MVSSPALHRAAHELGYTLSLLYLVGMAVSVGLLWATFREVRMVLHVLNGGCLP